MALVRKGRISSIDYNMGMAQVVYQDRDNEVTSSMPYLNYNKEYHMPKIGENVLVLHLSNGESRGIIIGGYWNQSNRPKEAGEGLYRKELSQKEGEAYLRYKEKEKQFLIKAPEIILEDGCWRISLNDLLLRLEALDGDLSARKEGKS